MKTLVSLAAFLFFLFPSSLSLEAYDCSSSTTTFVATIEDFFPPCETLKDLETIQGALVELQETPTVTILHCKVTSTLPLSDDRTPLITTKTISRDACLNAHETRSIYLDGYHIRSLDTNGTVNHTVTRDLNNNEVLPTSQANSTIVYYNITLSKYNATYDLATNVINLRDGVVCDYDDFSYEDTSGQFFWKTPKLNDSPIYWGNISFTVSDRSIANAGIRYAVIATAERAFVIKTLRNFTVFDEDKVFVTELPNVYIVISKQVYQPVGHYKDRLRKVIYSEPFYNGGDTVVDISKRGCQREEQNMCKVLKSLPVNSRFPVPQMQSVAMKKTKYLFQFSICGRMMVTSRQSEQCYHDIPVKSESGRDLFLDPVSRFLSNKSEPVVCESSPTDCFINPILPCKKPFPPPIHSQPLLPVTVVQPQPPRIYFPPYLPQVPSHLIPASSLAILQAGLSPQDPVPIQEFSGTLLVSPLNPVISPQTPLVPQLTIPPHRIPIVPRPAILPYQTPMPRPAVVRFVPIFSTNTRGIPFVPIFSTNTRGIPLVPKQSQSLLNYRTKAFM